MVSNHWENLNRPITSRLGKMIDHGGSSVVYELDQNQVVKEKLSKYAKDILGDGNNPITSSAIQKVREKEIQLSKEEKELILHELKENQARLINNIKICEKYLGNFLLKTEVLLQENKNTIPTIYIIQNKLPSDVKFLYSTKGFKIDDEGMSQLQDMITSVEKMFTETGMMIDLLSLDNVGFSEKNKMFYLFDIDPLICNEERFSELKNQYEVDFKIDHEFETMTENKTTNALEANFDHLYLLKSFLETKPD